MWREFVELAEKRQEPFISLCARFGISRKTGYKWLNRFRQAGDAGLAAQSRRPKTSPRRTPEPVVDAILNLRRENPDWSAARIQTALAESGFGPVPATSTIDLILRRQREAAAAQASLLGPEALRFEPNFRWTIQLGEPTRLADGTMLSPVFVRDDTTNFIVGAALIPIRPEENLTSWLQEILRRHGMPWRISLPIDAEAGSSAASRLHSPLSVWLMRLGIVVEFQRPHAGNDAGALLEKKLSALPSYQHLALEHRGPPDVRKRFAQEAGRLGSSEAWDLLQRLRDEENFRGHQQAMPRRSPMSLYRPSPRILPREVAPPVYTPEADIRLVSEKGIFTFRRRLIHVGRAFAGFCVELKETPYANRFIVLFAGQLLGIADLSAEDPGQATSLQLTPA